VCVCEGVCVGVVCGVYKTERERERECVVCATHTRVQTHLLTHNVGQWAVDTWICC